MLSRFNYGVKLYFFDLIGKAWLKVFDFKGYVGILPTHPTNYSGLSFAQIDHLYAPVEGAQRVRRIKQFGAAITLDFQATSLHSDSSTSVNAAP
jgi:hypothetical protein